MAKKERNSSPRYNLLGRRFGKLVVEKFVGKDKDGNRLWFCKCDCGGTAKIPTRKLLDQNHPAVTNCGCDKKRKGVKPGTPSKRLNVARGMKVLHMKDVLNLTLTEIGRRLNISQQRASQIYHRFSKSNET